MWGDAPLPEIEDDKCRHCQADVTWRWESEDNGQWMHRKSRSIRCDLFAEPKVYK